MNVSFEISLLRRFGELAALTVGLGSCGLIDDDEEPAGHVLTPEQEEEHNAPIGSQGCGRPNLESLELDQPIAIDVDAGEDPGPLVSTVDDCGNMVFGWGRPENRVVRLLASGEEDFQRTVAAEGENRGGVYRAITTDAFGNIFGAADGIVRLTASGDDFPGGRFLPYEADFLIRDHSTFLSGYWGYARLDVATNEFVWRSKFFGEPVSFPGEQLVGAPLDEESFLVLSLMTEDASDESAPLTLDRYTLVHDSAPNEFWLTTTPVWSRELTEELESARLASRKGKYAFGLSLGSEALGVVPCESSLEWPSRGARHVVSGCDYVQEVMFHPDGSLLSLWLDAATNEPQLRLLRWLPDEAEPREKALDLGLLGAHYERAASMALRTDGVVAVSAFAEDRLGLRVMLTEVP